MYHLQGVIVAVFRKYSTSAVTTGSAPFVLCNALTPTDEGMGTDLGLAGKYCLLRGSNLSLP